METGREVVIVEAVRTPIGRGHPEKGYYKETHPNELLGKCFTEVIARAGIEPGAVEDVIGGCVQQYGEQMFNVTRNAWLQAGLPIETPATTVDRQCGSAQQAVNFAAALIAAGVHDAVIGGGVEHMGHIPMGVGFKWVDDVGSPWPPAMLERYNLVPQGISAEMIADKWEIPRSEMDELAVRSHQRAARATEEGRFERETIPFAINGTTYVADQGVRPDTSLEALAGLKPAFRAGGSVTAGNSAGINDGAAAVLVASEAAVERYGLVPLARVTGSATAGVPPRVMGLGPVPATRRLLDRAGLTVTDIDVVELNEAFAAQALAVLRDLGLPDDAEHVDPHGGAIALGHPLGMTGARLALAAARELGQRDARRAVATMCIGVGQGISLLLER
jgi:acetyl-CoA acyltransferase